MRCRTASCWQQPPCPERARKYQKGERMRFPQNVTELIFYHGRMVFVWPWLVVNDRKFLAETVFFSRTNQPAVLLYEPATKRTSQPNRLCNWNFSEIVFLPKVQRSYFFIEIFMYSRVQASDGF